MFGPYGQKRLLETLTFGNNLCLKSNSIYQGKKSKTFDIISLFFVMFRCKIFNIFSWHKYLPIMSILEAWKQYNFFLPENWTTWHKIASIHFTCTLGQRQSNNNEIKVWWNEFHWKLTFRVNLKFIYGARARNKDVLSESRTRFLQREVDPHS